MSEARHAETRIHRRAPRRPSTRLCTLEPSVPGAHPQQLSAHWRRDCGGARRPHAPGFAKTRATSALGREHPVEHDAVEGTGAMRSVLIVSPSGMPMRRDSVPSRPPGRPCSKVEWGQSGTGHSLTFGKRKPCRCMSLVVHMRIAVARLVLIVPPPGEKSETTTSIRLRPTSLPLAKLEEPVNVRSPEGPIAPVSHCSGSAKSVR